MTTRVAVVGVGGIGGYIGGMISRASGVELTYCVRRPFDQLVLDVGDELLECTGTAIADPELAQFVDYVLVATKAYDTAAVAPWLGRLCGPDTVVAVLQNGVEQVALVQPLVPSGVPVVPVIVSYGAIKLAAGRVRRTVEGRLVVPLAGEAAAGLADLFATAGLHAEREADFEVALWHKLASNVASNPLCALFGISANRLPRATLTAALVRGLVSECVAVASAEGVRLPADLPETFLAKLASFDDRVVPSMSADRSRGTPLEIDALNGVVVRLGARHGVPTPYNQQIVELLEAIQ